MALWGTRDSFSLTGTANVSNLVATTTVTGTGTAFDTELDLGDMITIGTTKHKVVTITSNVSITIDPAYSGANVTGGTLTGQDTPKYLLPADGANTFGVDSTEALATVRDAGWVLRNTYTDTHGNSRDKREVLVAASSYTGDAEDVVYPDIQIIIQTEPSSVTANTAVANGETSFTVSAVTRPLGGTIIYQWQEAANANVAFSDLSDGGIYANTNEATLNLANTVGLDGYLYRVEMFSTGIDANVYSTNATLTVI